MAMECLLVKSLPIGFFEILPFLLLFLIHQPPQLVLAWLHSALQDVPDIIPRWWDARLLLIELTNTTEKPLAVGPCGHVSRSAFRCPDCKTLSKIIWLVAQLQLLTGAIIADPGDIILVESRLIKLRI